MSGTPVILVNQSGEVYAGGGRICPNHTQNGAKFFKSSETAQKFVDHIDPKAKGFKPMPAAEHRELFPDAGNDMER